MENQAAVGFHINFTKMKKNYYLIYKYKSHHKNIKYLYYILYIILII